MDGPVIAGDLTVCITNALIRCRTSLPVGLPFEQIGEVANLWVWELGPSHGITWQEWMSETNMLLTSRLSILKGLRYRSEDYTLHMAVSCRTDIGFLHLSREFIEISSEAGFQIELQIDREWPLPDASLNGLSG